ncbi:MAG: hypothetical protein UT39_C0002G0083 [Candidatus Woesebacteria bacterium GW2011_GWA1_39_21]|uniref:Uncharacterized protein n=1 Tax=Candidatus Woesebacteria bacterium GW2011_GWA1_39_21 TaxID=1618550 RepID=A0A0G0RE00_9BACT|nr:MAG: hypothetical protein UT39_C0002G0083 [Candidatus Woesebacteria bacterium GW2011_GWA1_39_21]
MQKGVIKLKEQEPNFFILFAYFFKKIADCGLSKSEYEEIKNQPICHENVSEFVQANINLGNFEWKNNRLYNVQRRNFLDLTDKTLASLRLNAMQAGLTEVEYAGKIIEDHLNK